MNANAVAAAMRQRPDLPGSRGARHAVSAKRWQRSPARRYQELVGAAVVVNWILRICGAVLGEWGCCPDGSEARVGGCGRNLRSRH